jgi:hypothetical protein
VSQDFYNMSYNGSLPALSWVVPGTDPRNGKGNSDHPCNDVALGERLQKDIYEALRAGPGWNKARRSPIAIRSNRGLVVPLFVACGWPLS